MMRDSYGWFIISLVLILGGGKVTACLGIGEDIEYGTGVELDLCDAPMVVNVAPVDDANVTNPFSFTCAVYNTNISNISSVSVYAWQGGVLEYTTTDSSITDHVTLFSGNSFDTGVYDWSCYAELDNGSTNYAEEGNKSLNVTSITADPVVSGGNCLTDTGYGWTESQEYGTDWTLYDFTELRTQGYTFDDTVKNIYVSGAPSYYYAANKILVDSSGQSTYILYLGGHNLNYSRDTSTPTPDRTITVSLDNFTQLRPAYRLYIRHEEDATEYTPAAYDSIDLTVTCESFSPDELDIKNDMPNYPIFLTTEETPIFSFDVEGNTTDRVFQPYNNLSDINIYFGNSTTVPLRIVDYELQDYTSSFQDSYFKIIKNINASLETIYQKQWYNLLVEDVEILNGSYLQYILYTPDEERRILWDRVTENKTQTIVVTVPSYEDQRPYMDDVLLGFTSSYTSSTVGVTWNITDDNLTLLQFRVYNYTDSQYVLEHAENSTSQVGDINYVVDQNSTYYLTCEITHADHGTIKISEILSPRKSTGLRPYMDGFDLPDEIAGVLKEHIFTAASIFIITAVAFMFGALEVPAGGAITVGTVGVVTYLGWFPEMTWELFTFISGMSLIMLMVGKRRKEG